MQGCLTMLAGQLSCSQLGAQLDLASWYHCMLKLQLMTAMHRRCRSTVQKTALG